MKTIYKYSIPLAERPLIELPIHATILHIAEQHPGELYLWALVDTNQMRDTELKQLVLVGTGHEVPDEPIKHLQTCVTLNGAFVWHIFEVLS